MNNTILSDLAHICYNKVFKNLLTLSNRNDKNSRLDFTIYSGLTGILFFIRQYINYFKNFEDLNKLENIHEHLSNNIKNKSMFGNGFGSDLLSTAYYLANFEKKTYKKLLPYIKKNLLEESLNDFVPNDVVGGIAGDILLLGKLIEINNDQELIKEMKRRILSIVSRTKNFRSFYYLDKNINNQAPLSGYSHGITGIAHTLLEVSRNSHSKLLKDFATKLYLQEIQRFDDVYCEWQDYRNNLKTPNYVIDPNKKAKFMSAWCHGSPGIAPSIKHASLYLDLFGFEKIISRVTKKMETDTIHSLSSKHTNISYCHGIAGNLECLLFMHGNKNYVDLIEKFARHAISLIENNKFVSGIPIKYDQDYSLFNGISSVGYFAMRTLDDTIPSFLHQTFSLISPIPIYENEIRRAFECCAYPILSDYIMNSEFSKLRDNQNSDCDIDLIINGTQLTDKLKKLSSQSKANRIVLKLIDIEKKIYEHANQHCRMITYGESVKPSKTLKYKLSNYCFFSLLDAEMINVFALSLKRLEIRSEDYKGLLVKFNHPNQSYHFTNTLSSALFEVINAKSICIDKIVSLTLEYLQFNLRSDSNIETILRTQINSLIENRILIPSE